MDVGFKGLKGGLLVLLFILAAIIGLYVTGVIGTIVVGKTVQTGTSTALNVSNASSTAISGLETSYISNQTTVFSNLPIIIGLVALVVLIAVFGVKLKIGSGGKGVE
jgi:hypothetical protein